MVNGACFILQANSPVDLYHLLHGVKFRSECCPVRSDLKFVRIIINYPTQEEFENFIIQKNVLIN